MSASARTNATDPGRAEGVGLARSDDAGDAREPPRGRRGHGPDGRAPSFRRELGGRRVLDPPAHGAAPNGAVSRRRTAMYATTGGTTAMTKIATAIRIATRSIVSRLEAALARALSAV
jgi:hypothetical protein